MNVFCVVRSVRVDDRVEPRLPEAPRGHLPTAAKWLVPDQDIEIQVLDFETAARWWIRVVSNNSEFSQLEQLERQMADHYDKRPPKTGYS